jgi:GMP synthase-like glutamine amidotransferase
LDLTPEGVADPVFGRICVPLVPTLHGECFSIPTGATKLAEGMMLRRDGTYARINMAFRYANSYGFQFEPQLTLAELEVWHRELREDYRLMGPAFDPDLEASRHLLEFARYAPIYEAQMAELLRAFLLQAELN